MGLSGDWMRAGRRSGEDCNNAPGRVCERGGESSQLESERAEMLSVGDVRRGHWIRTRASWTSTMTSVPSVSLVKVSPLNSSQLRPWQCSLRPFQPLQMISILLDCSGPGAGIYRALTWTREIRRLADSWKWDELEERPMMRISPFSASSTDGTDPRGTRSEGLRASCGLRRGELDRIPVLDVGTGVGYLRWASWPRFWRLSGRGRAGDDERGSNGGRRDGADLFDPASEEEDVVGKAALSCEVAVACAGVGSCGSPTAASAGREDSDSMFFAKQTAINHSQAVITGGTGPKPRQFASNRGRGTAYSPRTKGRWTGKHVPARRGGGLLRRDGIYKTSPDRTRWIGKLEDISYSLCKNRKNN